MEQSYFQFGEEAEQAKRSWEIQGVREDQGALESLAAAARNEWQQKWKLY